MKERTRIVGYNRTVKLRWLEHTAQLAAGGHSQQEIRDALTGLLRGQLSVGSNARRGSREKTITLLLKTWVRIPGGIGPFRDEGLKLLREEHADQHLAIHWGMTMAVYPFWHVVAETTGRLLRLQEAASSAQIQRRIREKLGERETVARSARYVIRAFVDWGAMTEAGKKGIYRAVPSQVRLSRHLSLWLIEAVLYGAGNRASEIDAVADSPALFPFHLSPVISGDLLRHSRLDITHQGSDRTLVALRAAR